MTAGFDVSSASVVCDTLADKQKSLLGVSRVVVEPENAALVPLDGVGAAVDSGEAGIFFAESFGARNDRNRDARSVEDVLDVFLDHFRRHALRIRSENIAVHSFRRLDALRLFRDSCGGGGVRRPDSQRVRLLRFGGLRLSMLKRRVERVVGAKKSDEKRVLEARAVQRQNQRFSGAGSERSFDASFASIEESPDIVLAAVEWPSGGHDDTLAIHDDQVDGAGEALVQLEVVV